MDQVCHLTIPTYPIPCPYLECIFIADDRESMLIYTQNGNQMAVIITLPFITCVRSRLFGQLIERAHEVSHTISGCKKKKKLPGRNRKTWQVEVNDDE